jgi:hypothetical protein
MHFPEVLLPRAELVHSITTTMHQASYNNIAVSLFKFVIIFIRFILCVNSSPVFVVLLSITVLFLSNDIILYVDLGTATAYGSLMSWA